MNAMERSEKSNNRVFRIQINGEPAFAGKAYRVSETSLQQVACDRLMRNRLDSQNTMRELKRRLALLKYETAMPFYRLEQFLKQTGDSLGRCDPVAIDGVSFQ